MSSRRDEFSFSTWVRVRERRLLLYILSQDNDLSCLRCDVYNFLVLAHVGQLKPDLVIAYALLQLVVVCWCKIRLCAHDVQNAAPPDLHIVQHVQAMFGSFCLCFEKSIKRLASRPGLLPDSTPSLLRLVSWPNQLSSVKLNSHVQVKFKCR